MDYISTRGGMSPQPFSNILLGGLAPDGGLTIPSSYPQFSIKQLQEMSTMNYVELAHTVMHPFISDIPEDELYSLIEKTYTADVYCNGRNPESAHEITPIVTLQKDLFILELSNGPTLAFKDMAMQMLGNLFEYVLLSRDEEINILGATSGDTGSAAEYALRGKRGVNVFMLSPYNRMSPFQRAQMFSLQDANIHNIAVKSMFDGCQDLVKAVNNDAQFKEQYKIGAVNSINWGRIIAQVVYYFKGYFAVVDTVGEPVDFAVPSGNFGNVCAGHIARQCGLPIRKLIVATNENDVLDEFFKTGLYAPRTDAQTYATSSPSMDISKASNLERFVFDLVNRDAVKLSQLWAHIEKGASFQLDEATHKNMSEIYGFTSAKSCHADRLAMIKEVYNLYGLFIDTHTADGYKAAKEMHEPGVKMIITETALAAKFEETIHEALGILPPRPTHLQAIEELEQSCVIMEPSVVALKDFIVSHLSGHE